MLYQPPQQRNLTKYLGASRQFDFHTPIVIKTTLALFQQFDDKIYP